MKEIPNGTQKFQRNRHLCKINYQNCRINYKGPTEEMEIVIEITFEIPERSLQVVFSFLRKLLMKIDSKIPFWISMTFLCLR